MGSKRTLERDRLCWLGASALTRLRVPGWREYHQGRLANLSAHPHRQALAFLTLQRLPTGKFPSSTSGQLPDGCSLREGAARAWYVPDIVLLKLGLKCKYIPKAGGLELSPNCVIQASRLSNLRLFTLPASSTDPLFAKISSG